MKGRNTSFLTSALVFTLLIQMLTTEVLLGADVAAGENISGLFFSESFDDPNLVGRGWFDGKLVVEHNDVIFRSTDFPEMKFNQFLLTPYFGPGLLPHGQTLWIDELAVGNQRIGRFKKAPYILTPKPSDKWLIRFANRENTTNNESNILPQWAQHGYNQTAVGQSPYKGPHTNKLKWELVIPGWGSSVVIAGDGTAYITGGGTLGAVGRDGRVKWDFDLPVLKVNLDVPEKISPEEEKKLKKEYEEILREEIRGYIPGIALAKDGTIYVTQALAAQQEPFRGFYSESERYLVATNPDGSEKWRFSVGDKDIVTHIAIGSDGAIFFGTCRRRGWSKPECTVYAVHPDGTEKWTRFLPEAKRISSPAVVDDGTVYVGGSKFWAINSRDGSIKWEHNIQTVSDTYGPAAGKDGTVYIAEAPWEAEEKKSLRLYAFDPNGTVKWTLNAGGMEMTPAVGSDGTIYIHTWPDVMNLTKGDAKIPPGLHAINPDGTVEWSFANLMKFADWHFDPLQLGMTWGSDSSPIIGADGVIYFGSDVGIIYAVNPDGTLLWDLEIGGEFDNRPAIDSEGVLYICHAGGPGEIHGGPLKCYGPSASIRGPLLCQQPQATLV